MVPNYPIIEARYCVPIHINVYFAIMIRILLLLLLLSPSVMIAQSGTTTLEEVQAMPDDTTKVLAWVQLSSQMMNSNIPQGQIYGDSALALATRIGFKRGIALGHRQVAVALYYGGNLADALTHYEPTLEYYRSVGDKKNVANILSNMGLAKRNQSDFEGTMAHFFEAMAIYEEIGNDLGLASSYQRIGETYAITNEYELAEEYFVKALEGFRELGEEANEHTMLLNMGGFYREKGEPDKALPYIKEALAYFESTGTIHEIARGYYNLGGVYLDKNNLDESEEAYIICKVYFDSLGHTMRSVGCLLNLSEIAFRKGNNARAVSLAEEARKLSAGIGTTNQEANALFKLYTFAKARNQYSEALGYHESYKALQDSINLAESKKAIAELDKKYQTERRDREVAELSATNAMNELALKKQRNRQNVQTAITALVLLSTVLLFFLYRNHKRSNLALQEKNAIIQTSLTDKEVLLKEIHHRVKNNLQFISSLLNLQARHVADPNTLAMLTEGKNRINSMAILHQKLYQEDNLKGVNMKDYIENLLESLEHSLKVDATRIDVVAQIDPMVLDIDTATPIGLVLNELITNAFKYAFPGEANGRVLVRLREENNHLMLQVKDNGVGLPAGFDSSTSKSFGMELVQSLAQKLKARVDISGHDGVDVTLNIESFNKA